MSRDFADFMVESLNPLGPVLAKRMFGGYGVYLDGRMFGLILDDVLYLKTDDQNRPAYEAEGCPPFMPFADGRAAMPYHRAPEFLLDEPDELVAWAREAVAAARRAPPPVKRRKRPSPSALSD